MSQVKLNEPYVKYSTAIERIRSNQEQWEALNTRSSCVVLAGPGSGKTQVLTTRIAQTLSERVASPRKVACITYSNQCVEDLSSRLSEIGVARNDPRLFLGTVHSFCYQNILLTYGKVAGFDVSGYAVASNSTTERIFFEARQEVMGAGSRLKKSDFDKHRNKCVFKSEADWITHAELSKVVLSFERRLSEEGLIDFNSMALGGARLVCENQWIVRALNARFPYIVVDEYQDLGHALHSMISRLCLLGKSELFAVGDPDQTIYSFTGADPTLLTKLASDPAIAAIRLRKNYRSGQGIINVAARAIGADRGYVPANNTQTVIQAHHRALGRSDQINYICDDLIPAILERDVNRTLGSIGILYKDKNDGAELSLAIERRSLPYVRNDGGTLYPRSPLMLWVEDCAHWCAGGWQLGKPNIKGLEERWEQFNRSNPMAKRRNDLNRNLVKFLFGNKNTSVSVYSWLKRFYSTCLKETFGSEAWLKDEKETFVGLGKAARDLPHWTLADFVAHRTSSDRLQLLTLHGSKGLEFDAVIMFGMDDGHLPSWWDQSDAGIEDARRLFYVGVTRPRAELHFTFTGWRTDGYQRIHRDGPTRFLLGIGLEGLA